MGIESESSNSVTLYGQLQVTLDHLDVLARDHVRDFVFYPLFFGNFFHFLKKHFTARWLTLFKTKLGIDVSEAVLAKVIVAAFCAWLAFAEKGCFAVNVLLTLTPLLLSLCYPDEKAASEDMLAYW